MYPPLMALEVTMRPHTTVSTGVRARPAATVMRQNSDNQPPSMTRGH